MFNKWIKNKLGDIKEKASSNISATIVADSLHPQDHSCRLTTFKTTQPRFAHADFMTHRAFSRNASSSRATPLIKNIKEVWDNPALPVYWGKNQAGMQAKSELSDFSQLLAYYVWIFGSKLAVVVAYLLMKLNLHKQTANRILEPFIYIDVVITATDFDNFYFLRDHEDAQPELKCLTGKMLFAHNNSTPKILNHQEWHLPFVNKQEDVVSIDFHETLGTMLYKWNITDLVKFSVARCARVSYRNHDQSDPKPMKDIGLHDQLRDSNHWSPFEHQAQPADPTKYYGNFKGWMQYRQTFPQQNTLFNPKLKKY